MKQAVIRAVSRLLQSFLSVSMEGELDYEEVEQFRVTELFRVTLVVDVQFSICQIMYYKERIVLLVQDHF